MTMADIDLRKEAPDPPSAEYVRALCDRVGGQREAARILRYDQRTLRRWVTGDTRPTWAVVELLRRLTREQR